jgi:hypothetical protein
VRDDEPLRDIELDEIGACRHGGGERLS